MTTQATGMCPVPITVTGITGPVTVLCELGDMHPHAHLAAGHTWLVDKGTGAPVSVKRLTRTGI